MNEYDAWNTLKKEVSKEIDQPDRFPKEGEVWVSVFGKNIGFEENGTGESFSRPVLIVKKFNNLMFWSVPLSTKQKKLDFYFNFTDPNSLPVAAILAQMKLISVKRLRRKLYDIPQEQLTGIKEKLRTFL